MMFQHSNRKATETEVGTREGAAAVTDRIILIFGRMWRTLGLWTRKAVKCCKWGLTGHPSKSLHDSSTKSNVDLEA